MLTPVLLTLAVLPAQTPPPTAVPATPVNPTAVPPALADWTPRPATGPAAPWEKATDKDWVDGRFRLMDTGPFLNATLQFPHGRGKVTVYKGTAVRLGDRRDAGVIFDRGNLLMSAGWVGVYLAHSDRRFGLLNTPQPVGQLVFGTQNRAGWAGPNGEWTAAGLLPTRPLPEGWGRYRGLYLHADRVVFRYTVGGVDVLDSPHLLATDRGPTIARTIRMEAAPKSNSFVAPSGLMTIRAGSVPRTLAFTASGQEVPAEDLVALTRPGPRRWGEPIVTKLVRGAELGPFAVDTLTLPYQNRFNALFFCTGLDFLPDGRLAVCTCHGDVWLAAVDDAKGEVSWQRFATGLYHPLGLKVVDGQVVVLERGQLTRLHDGNSDGEADFYECISNYWDTGAGEHSYDTCLETDPQGNYLFFKTGDTHLPTGGCLLRVSKDGAKTEIVATGFRHPIGLGMSPTGVITGADQEGNWMPATRVDEYKPGGFYGDMRAHHRAKPPTRYDGPLCWLPREVDNSAGGQVWVPDKAFGPLAGLPLHLSYGRCKAFVLLRDEYPGGVQGGVWDLGLTFLSGTCRGRFHPDGSLYVCGLNGWQTAAKADGCVQRVRSTGKPLDVPTKLEVVPDGVRLTFSRPLDKATAENPANYRAAWWNYKWSGEYGSKRYRASDGRVGQDDVPVAAAKLLADGRTVHVVVPGMRPVMQMQVGANIKAADGAAVVGSVYLTVHHTGR